MVYSTITDENTLEELERIRSEYNILHFNPRFELFCTLFDIDLQDNILHTSCSTLKGWLFNFYTFI